MVNREIDVNMDYLNLYCRLCADLKPDGSLTDMEKNNEKSQEIIDKLMRLNRQVDFTNKLPKTVCSECINSLERAYEFVNMVDLAQEAFEDYDASASDTKEDEVVSDFDITEMSYRDDDSVKTEGAMPENESDESGMEDTITETSIKDDDSVRTSWIVLENESDESGKGDNITETSIKDYNSIRTGRVMPENESVESGKEDDITEKSIKDDNSVRTSGVMPDNESDDSGKEDDITETSIKDDDSVRTSWIVLENESDESGKGDNITETSIKDYNSIRTGRVMPENESVESGKEDDITEKSIKDDNSVRTSGVMPDNESDESGKDSKIESDSKTELTEINYHTDSPGLANVKVTVIKNPDTCKAMNKPEITAEPDPWHDYHWLCAYCEKYFLNPSELKIHSMQYHTTCNPYRCYDCRARGLHMNNFITHICKHRPHVTLTCHCCTASFSTLEDLKTHRATHIRNEHACRGCNSSFSTQQELEVHMKKFYQDAVTSLVPKTLNEELKCVICDRISKTKLLLNRHILLHTDRKRSHLCDICGDSFYNRKEVVQHQSVHTDARPYKCEVCTFSFKNFTNWSNYNRHMRNVHGVIHSTRKRTSEGLYALDPVTKEVVYPDEQKVLEWKRKILADVRKGRPKSDVRIVETEEKSIVVIDDQVSNG